MAEIINREKMSSLNILIMKFILRVKDRMLRLNDLLIIGKLTD